MIGPALQGPCRDADPELFFGETNAEVEAAKAVCRSCPVQNRAMCLTWAIEVDLKFGVAGGMTRRERERYTRRAA